MAEYIEREKVLELIDGWKRDDAVPHCVGYSEGWNEALEQIKYNIEELHIPAADIRPERHGQWIDIDKQNVWGDDEPVNLFRCSACKISTETRKDHIDRYHFCPNCGAKMDGKDGESDEQT